jgi:hypothetical protein
MDAYATSGVGAICDISDDGGRLECQFTQFHPIPGAQNQFHIVEDPVSGLFWMTTNLPTNSQDLKFDRQLEEIGFKGTPGNERRFLMLFYSLDALNWFQAGCVAMLPSPLQSFNYATAVVDGEDLLIVSRSSLNAVDQHDNDAITFHRVKGFRDLALDLNPQFP